MHTPTMTYEQLVEKGKSAVANRANTDDWGRKYWSHWIDAYSYLAVVIFLVSESDYCEQIGYQR